MPGKPTTEADEARLNQAATLLAYAAGWWRDYQYCLGGGKLYYATDIDVVAMQIAPVNNAHYADVFSQNGSETAELLARLIGDFIFFRQARVRDIPLLIIGAQLSTFG